jgi:hypothetical protein
VTIYILIKPADITNKLVNLSTSQTSDSAPTLADGRVILEFDEKYKDYILDFVWYTAEQVRQIREDLESQGQSSRWYWPF